MNDQIAQIITEPRKGQEFFFLFISRSLAIIIARDRDIIQRERISIARERKMIVREREKIAFPRDNIAFPRDRKKTSCPFRGCVDCTFCVPL